MLLDPRSAGNGAELAADVCVIGAGPCGLVLALALAARGRDVLLLESGQRWADAAAQALNEGEARGADYAGLAATRHRQLGGTPHTWNTPLPNGRMGAKYCPLDAMDLEGWPVDAAALAPWYREAQATCGVGGFAYDAEAWREPGRLPWPGIPGVLEPAVYQFGPADLFTHRLPAQAIASPRVRLLPGATACRIGHRGGRAEALDVALGSRHRITVRPEAVVLAAGGIENARLLMASGLDIPWLGRAFMEHPRDYSLVLRPAPGRGFDSAVFFDSWTAASGTVACGRMGLAPGVRRRERLPNAAVSVHLRRRPGTEGPLRRVLQRAGLLAPPFGGGYGWSRRGNLDREFSGFRLVVNLEQRPRWENRLTLEGPPDALGIPRAVLEYAWLPEEQADLERIRQLLAAWCRDAGIGHLEVHPGAPPDLSAHHHAGTTRMGHTPGDSVVTPDCRVHGMANVHVTGASVFPTAGFANPTLTAVALSLRLAAALGPTPGAGGASDGATAASG